MMRTEVGASGGGRGRGEEKEEEGMVAGGAEVLHRGQRYRTQLQRRERACMLCGRRDKVPQERDGCESCSRCGEGDASKRAWHVAKNLGETAAGGHVGVVHEVEHADEHELVESGEDHGGR